VDSPSFEHWTETSNSNFFCVGSIPQRWIKVFNAEEAIELSHFIFEHILKSLSSFLFHSEAMRLH